MSRGAGRGLLTLLPTDLQPAPRHIIVVPSDFAHALEAAPEALHYFEALPYAQQRRVVAAVEAVRTLEARPREIATAIERLRTEGTVI